MAKEKLRLDQLVLRAGFAQDLARAQSLILSGSILVEDRVETRVGISFDSNISIRLRERIKSYVSRGSVKLMGALESFPSLTIQNKICMDLGASTGGFTQVLLEQGALHVLAIDVGYGQMADRLQKDPRVHVLDRFHIKNLTWSIFKEQIPSILTHQKPSVLVTMDLSFISLRSILPGLRNFFLDSGLCTVEVVALVKPQFEIKNTDILERGILKDRKVAISILKDTARLVRKDLKGKIHGLVNSPITGTDGNHEFFIFFSWIKDDINYEIV